MKQNLEADDPFAAGGHGQELVDLVGDVGSWLMGQAQIGEAVDESCK
jgi:hypothetical protein